MSSALYTDFHEFLKDFGNSPIENEASPPPDTELQPLNTSSSHRKLTTPPKENKSLPSPSIPRIIVTPPESALVRGSTNHPLAISPRTHRNTTLPTVTAETRFARIPPQPAFLSPEPFTSATQHCHPGSFPPVVFNGILESPAIPISSSDLINTSVETEFQGVAFRLKVNPAFFLHLGWLRPITRGTRITYESVESLTTQYIVTWTRRRHDGPTTTLVQVNAFLRNNQCTHPPFSKSWPALLLEVPSYMVDHDKTPYPPSPRQVEPSTPSNSSDHGHSTSATEEVPAITGSNPASEKKTSLFHFIWTRFLAPKTT